MLAAKAGPLEQLRFPVFATPKIDGIRCLTMDALVTTTVGERSVPVSRSLKPIPNRYIFDRLSIECIPGLDGELITGQFIDGKWKPDPFNDVSSNVMTNLGMPTFRYIVFDYGHTQSLQPPYPVVPYRKRINMLSELELPDFCIKLMPQPLNSLEELLAYEEAMLLEGYEGVMIRTPDSPYKFGRSTLKEQWLVKIKRFEDDEAEVIGYEELMHNDNPQETSETGYAERSTHKENMRPGDILGKFVVRGLTGRFKGVEFRVGSGFTLAQRQEIWKMPSMYLGSIIKFRHQPHGAVDKPRVPVFIGWRHNQDMF